MFNLLDIAYPGRPYRPRIIIEPDTIKITVYEKALAGYATAHEESIDSLIPQELIDTLTSKDGVMDTIRSAANFITDFGAGNGHASSLLMTTLVVVAALTLCGGFIWMYRRNLMRQGNL